MDAEPGEAPTVFRAEPAGADAATLVQAFDRECSAAAAVQEEGRVSLPGPPEARGGGPAQPALQRKSSVAMVVEAIRRLSSERKPEPRVPIHELMALTADFVEEG